MTTKKIVLVVGGVVVVLALIVVCFAVGIAGFAWYQIGNSEAAAKAKEGRHRPGAGFWKVRRGYHQSRSR